MNLGHPADPTSKGDKGPKHAGEAGQARSASRTPRETRAAGSGLDCAKPNPDRGRVPPLTTGRTP